MMRRATTASGLGRRALVLSLPRHSRYSLCTVSVSASASASASASPALANSTPVLSLPKFGNDHQPHVVTVRHPLSLSSSSSSSLSYRLFSSQAGNEPDEKKPNDKKPNDKMPPHPMTTFDGQFDEPIGVPPIEATIVEETKKKIEFKAETRQILEIMTHSLYTDKEVFLRELVSNASDALEKLRHVQTANIKPTIDPDLPLEIHIDFDEVTSSITISDTGIGMTRDDMIANLGTIAKSGSREFMEDLKRVDAGGEIDPKRGIIGKFGVGFYSVFMIAERVQVISRSALVQDQDIPPQMWTSDGNGFEVGDVEAGIRVPRGTSVRLDIDSEYWHFVSEQKLEEIIKNYSRFVGFPIYLMGRQINTVDAIWTRPPNQVQEQDYFDFYKYITNAVDDPLDTIHFRAEAPLDVKALFFIPSFHQEKQGMARMEPSVSLYCRKVLIEANSKDILPEWLRFLKGVVDSEDLPLSISREKPQDSALIVKLRKALTRKVLSHLTKMQRNDEKTYVDEFYKEYSFFLKEGACQDEEFVGTISKLLYFETSKNPAAKIITLDEYIGNMRPEQQDIYYLCAPTRDAAVSSPYMETFDKAGVEVLYVYSAIDDFVMASVKKYEGRNIYSVEKSDIDLSKFAKPEEVLEEEKDALMREEDDLAGIYKAKKALTPEQCVELCNWYRDTFNTQVASCTITNRLHSSPAIVTDHESGTVRRMMRLLDHSGTDSANRDEVALPKQHLEINPLHPIIVGIHDLRATEPALAKLLAAQVFDNCLMAAGLLDDSRSVLPRLNDLMICVVNGALKNNKIGNNQDNLSTTTSSSSATVVEPPKLPDGPDLKM